jgi:hypothetical protein
MKGNMNESMTKNKCEGCDNSYTHLGPGCQYQTCTLDSKVVNAYGCDRDLLGNNAEVNPNYPDDPNDVEDEDYDKAMDAWKDNFLDKHQQGYY